MSEYEQELLDQMRDEIASTYIANPALLVDDLQAEEVELLFDELQCDKIGLVEAIEASLDDGGSALVMELLVSTAKYEAEEALESKRII